MRYSGFPSWCLKIASWHFLRMGFRQVLTQSLSNGSRQCWPSCLLEKCITQTGGGRHFARGGILRNTAEHPAECPLGIAGPAAVLGAGSHALSPSPGSSIPLSRAEEPHAAPVANEGESLPAFQRPVGASLRLAARTGISLGNTGFAAEVSAGAAPASPHVVGDEMWHCCASASEGTSSGPVRHGQIVAVHSALVL